MRSAFPSNRPCQCCGSEPAFWLPAWNDTLCRPCIRLGLEFDALANKRRATIWRMFRERIDTSVMGRDPVKVIRSDGSGWSPDRWTLDRDEEFRHWPRKIHEESEK